MSAATASCSPRPTIRDFTTHVVISHRASINSVLKQVEQHVEDGSCAIRAIDYLHPNADAQTLSHLCTATSNSAEYFALSCDRDFDTGPPFCCESSMILPRHADLLGSTTNETTCTSHLVEFAELVWCDTESGGAVAYARHIGWAGVPHPPEDCNEMGCAGERELE